LTSSWLLIQSVYNSGSRLCGGVPLVDFWKKTESSYQSKHLVTHAREDQHWLFSLRAHKMHQQAAASCLMHTEDVHAPRLLVTRPHELYLNLAVRREYSSPCCSGSTSTLPCATTTRHSAARALRQPCRAPRVLVSRPQWLYIDYAVCRRDVVFWAYDYFDYSSRLVN
jgi:hypothetical protein